MTEGSAPDAVMFDLGPAADRLRRLVDAVTDEQLHLPTPCTEWEVDGLLAHIHQFAAVFSSNARKQVPTPPAGLVADWRKAIPDQLDELADAWRRPSAWNGRVSAGGVEMAAADNAVVAIEELTVHGWDLARATGQEFRVDDQVLDLVDRFFEVFGPEPFGPATRVGESATRLQRTIARTGRHPLWRWAE